MGRLVMPLALLLVISHVFFRVRIYTVPFLKVHLRTLYFHPNRQVMYCIPYLKTSLHFLFIKIYMQRNTYYKNHAQIIIPTPTNL
jgi:hypothetical protein